MTDPPSLESIGHPRHPKSPAGLKDGIMKNVGMRGITRWTFLAVLLVAACTDGNVPMGVESSFDDSVLSLVTVDFESGNGEDFLFLRPLPKSAKSSKSAKGGSSEKSGKSGSSEKSKKSQRSAKSSKVPGPLKTGLDLTVTICDSSDLCTEIPAKEKKNDYRADWKSPRGAAGEEFSIVVTGAGVVLGEMTLTLEKKGSEKAGRKFSVRFWVGEGIGTVVETVQECVEADRCNTGVVPPPPPTGDPTPPPTVITTVDEEGDPLAEATFPASAVPDDGIVVSVDCRAGGFAAGEGPLPTDLDQWPMFCHVNVLNFDGTAFTGVLPDDARFEVCVVDETLDPNFHPFLDVSGLRLGKSSDGINFEFLTPGPNTLDCTGASQVATGPTSRVIRWMGSRLATILNPVLPGKLYASAPMFKDGGVGGLIRSFSDINPVDPASISGTIADVAGGPLAGVTVSLAGITSEVTTTDANGDYSFDPLQAEVGGTTYTVSVTDLPVDHDLAINFKVVSVTGTGDFTADFETAPRAGVFFNAATGNYYEAIATRLAWPDARTAATSVSYRGCVGDLTSITSLAENTFVVTNMPQVAVRGVPENGLGGGYWIGGFQPTGSAESAGGWSWINGEPFSFANWASGEPNDTTGHETRLQFLGDWGGGTNKVKWNDEPGGRAYGYVVEYSCPA
jgi:carboxypeptidase family protein